MSLGFKGAKDLIQKPFPTAGRTLDRVIKKVLGLANGAPKHRPSCAKEPAGRSAQDGEVADDTSKWLTVTQAAELLMHDVPGLNLAKARSRISTAASREEFRFAGASKDRRIEPDTFASWRLEHRDRDLDEEDRADNPV